MSFTPIRIALRLSQSELARLSGVHRLRIFGAEHGDVILSNVEQEKIRSALQAEMDRLRSLPAVIELAPVAAVADSKEGCAA